MPIVPAAGASAPALKKAQAILREAAGKSKRRRGMDMSLADVYDNSDRELLMELIVCVLDFPERLSATVRFAKFNRGAQKAPETPDNFLHATIIYMSGVPKTNKKAFCVKTIPKDSAKFIMRFDRRAALKGVDAIFSYLTGFDSSDKIPPHCHNKLVLGRVCELITESTAWGGRAAKLTISEDGEIVWLGLVFEFLPAEDDDGVGPRRLTRVKHVSGEFGSVPRSIYIEEGQKLRLTNGHSERHAVLDLGEGGSHPIKNWFAEGQLKMYLDKHAMAAFREDLAEKAVKELKEIEGEEEVEGDEDDDEDEGNDAEIEDDDPLPEAPLETPKKDVRLPEKKKGVEKKVVVVAEPVAKTRAHTKRAEAPEAVATPPPTKRKVQ